MSHLKVFRRHPKRTLTGLAAVLAAVAVAIGSGADFTASSSNTGNSLTAGTLAISNGTAGSVLTVSNLKPGGTAQTSNVDLQNSGSLSGVFSLYRGKITDSGNTDPTTFPISAKLDLSITDCGLFVGVTPPDCSKATPGNVYTGSLSGLSADSTKPVALGTFAGGAKHRFQFAVSLDKTADDNYQAGQSALDLNWSAVQS